MKQITATILTYNEEDRIEACLMSLAGVADEIVVVDSFSTDSTLDICRRYGCRIKQRRLAGYGAQRQYATSLASHNYILSIDADEMLSPALASEIVALKEEGFTHRVYTAPRLNFYCGRPVRYCGWYPDMQLRLFDRRYANWSLSEVAEQVIFRDSVNPHALHGDILHYRCQTAAEFRRKEKHHALLHARNIAADTSISTTPLTPLFEGLRSFSVAFFANKGIAAGMAGLTISTQAFRSAWLAFSTANRFRNENNTSHIG